MHRRIIPTNKFIRTFIQFKDFLERFWVLFYPLRLIITVWLQFFIRLDFEYYGDYNKSIFYERTVNTMTIFNKFYQMPKSNIITEKHGVCPKCSAMC